MQYENPRNGFKKTKIGYTNMYSLQWNMRNLTKPLLQAVSITIYHQGKKL